MRISPIIAAALVLAACQQKAPEQPVANEAAASPEGVGVKGVHRDHKGEPAPSATFVDPHGVNVSMEGFQHRPVLVNLWATWCAPCVKELPTLDRLQKAHEDGSLAVVAISQDDAPFASVEAFLKAHNIRMLVPFQDRKMAWSGALGPDTVLPTSILYDANGKEVWRYVGDLDWTSAEAAKLLAEAGASPKPS